MGGPSGRICRDLFGQSLHIKGKLVLDPSCNLAIANSIQQNAHISGNLFTNGICEYEMGAGIMLKGNVTLEDDYVLCVPTIKANAIIGNITNNVCVSVIQTTKVTEKIIGEGVIIDCYLPKKKFGLARVYSNTITSVNNGNTIQIPLLQKTFESTFTTSRGLTHPNGNVLVTFQSPSTSNINCEYTNALVRTDVSIGAAILNGEANDKLIFKLMKNGTSEVSKFTHELMGPCINVDQTFAWSDVVVLAPNDTLDVFVLGSDVSGNLSASIRPGTSDTFAVFEIESFEP